MTGNLRNFSLPLLLLLAVPCSSQAADGGASAEQLAAARASEARGEQLYRFDRAAWLATDRFRADLVAAKLSMAQVAAIGVSGYIVETGEAGSLAVVFYGKTGEAYWPYARYEIQGQAVTGEGILPQDRRGIVSSVGLRLIRARDAVMSVAGKQGHELCSASPPNTVVLPPETPDGPIDAYLLSSTKQSGSYPAGGHFRFTFAADGSLIGERRFMNSCFPINWASAGRQVEFVFLTHLLDPQPTEIHTFVSRNIPIALVIGTISSDRTWIIAGGKIEPGPKLPKQ